MVSQLVGGCLPTTPHLFFDLAPLAAGFLAFLILSSLPLAFPPFGRGKRAFFWVSAGTVAVQCVIASIPAEEREIVALLNTLFPLCARGAILFPPLPCSPFCRFVI